ncbi:Conserved hypothetical protein [Prochlorococcus marinus str. MIT 9303]|uniref:Uncharacterized protein n=1 Tax=Prochlorococcus marinus (strain MIT 9303) TaxID=59922 RepID=A2C8M8_PROM3|nr:Conserved hypothetical protein [Prochlorococcus marinus str. MIT 9303]
MNIPLPLRMALPLSPSTRPGYRWIESVLSRSLQDQFAC